MYAVIADSFRAVLEKGEFNWESGNVLVALSDSQEILTEEINTVEGLELHMVSELPSLEIENDSYYAEPVIITNFEGNFRFFVLFLKDTGQIISFYDIGRSIFVPAPSTILITWPDEGILSL